MRRIVSPTTARPTAAAPSCTSGLATCSASLLPQQADVAGWADPLGQGVDRPREILTGPLDLRDQRSGSPFATAPFDGHRTVNLDCPRLVPPLHLVPSAPRLLRDADGIAD